MPKSASQSPIEEQVVLDGLKYVRAIIKDLTRLCFDEEVSSKDVARSIKRDMRTTLSVPTIYAALRILHRSNAYLGIVSVAQEQDKAPRFPPSTTPVDFTVLELTRKWVSHIRMSASVESDWRDATWNPMELVHETVRRVVDYNSDAFFGMKFENQSK